MKAKVFAAGLAVLVLVALGSFLLAARSTSLDRAKYMASHHCREIGRRTVWVTSETIYRCDNRQIIVLPAR
jgi:hypothetical protein